MFWKRRAKEKTFDNVHERFQSALHDRNFSAATEATAEIFALAEKSCRENPSKTLELNYAAEEFENRAEWGAAESAYQQILSLPDLSPADEYKAHVDLAGLCRLLNRDSDSLEHARSATLAARRFDSSVLLLMAFQGEAGCLIRNKNFSEARQVVAEAISVLEPDKMYDQLRANVLMLKAECDLHCGAIMEAGQGLDQANCLLEPLAGLQIAAGIQSGLCHWWSVTARHRAQRGDCEGAISAWQKAVNLGKHVASLPQAVNVYTKCAVAQMLKGLADALLVCDRAEEAAIALDERKELIRRIGAPDNETE
jgi:tetratricopeptide (TPR) repeat protein